MQGTDKTFSGSIPELYERYLVPLIFEDYAEDLATRAAEAVPMRVLEIAAGTGVLTRAMTAKLPEGTSFVITDLNQPMLDYAAQRQGEDSRIEWRQADALELPFPEASFDVVLCQFGVMFFPDKIAGFAEARRVLTPGGRYLFNVWDRIEENEFAHSITETLAGLFPDDPPSFLARTPHGHHEVSAIERDLRAAGFADIAIETHAAVSRAVSPNEPAVAYCQGTPLRNEIEARDPARLEEATRAAAEALAERFGSGPIEGKIQGHIFIATR